MTSQPIGPGSQLDSCTNGLCITNILGNLMDCTGQAPFLSLTELFNFSCESKYRDNLLGRFFSFLFLSVDRTHISLFYIVNENKVLIYSRFQSGICRRDANDDLAAFCE